MDSGRLNFSIGGSGKIFCPFIVDDQNKELSIGNLSGSIKYDTS